MHGDWLSGLAHQRQWSGQPLRKTTVRIPGPSLRLNFCILKTMAVGAFVFCMSGPPNEVSFFTFVEGNYGAFFDYRLIIA